jgi:anionic cell wall polymer biosynthesis LytR-Cps2A-Psr (LCP) family protein
VGIIIVTTFILAVAIIRIYGIQNKIVQYATSFASNKTHTRVEIKKTAIVSEKKSEQYILYMRISSNDGFNGKIPVESACTC